MSLEPGFNEYCGTLDYISPEVVAQNPERNSTNAKAASFECDWWSVGILTYELLFGCTPFVSETQNKKETEDNILSKEPDLVQLVSTETIHNFLFRLLDKDPNTRLGSAPNGINDVKNHKFFASIDCAQLERRQYKAPLTLNLE